MVRTQVINENPRNCPVINVHETTCDSFQLFLLLVSKRSYERYPRNSCNSSDTLTLNNQKFNLLTSRPHGSPFPLPPPHAMQCQGLHGCWLWTDSVIVARGNEDCLMGAVYRAEVKGWRWSACLWVDSYGVHVRAHSGARGEREFLEGGGRRSPEGWRRSAKEETWNLEKQYINCPHYYYDGGDTMINRNLYL